MKVSPHAPSLNRSKLVTTLSHTQFYYYCFCYRRRGPYVYSKLEGGQAKDVKNIWNMDIKRTPDNQKHLVSAIDHVPLRRLEWRCEAAQVSEAP